MHSNGKLTTTMALLMIIIPHFSSFSSKFGMGCYTSIFSFGDSLTDTGNALHISRNKGQHATSDTFPYGETYFHYPTGRYCDGRIILDFLAQYLGIELIPPYFGVKGNEDIFMQGINFAVGGATAMHDSFLEQMGIFLSYQNISLPQQLTWFKDYCQHQSPFSCKEILKSSLFLLGEFGGNDYNHAFQSYIGFEETQMLVDPVIHSIGNAITELIEIGAVAFIVPGSLPIGCSFGILNLYPNSFTDPKTGCIDWINEFCQFHNHKLQTELQRIRHLHPHTTIIYADYYNAAMEIYQNPRKFGFKEGQGQLIPCYGGIGNVCSNPSEFINWDNTHLTEAAYKKIFNGLLKYYSYPSMEKSLSCISDM